MEDMFEQLDKSFNDESSRIKEEAATDEYSGLAHEDTLRGSRSTI